MNNFGGFLITIMQALLELPTKLYTALTTTVNISWVSKLLSFFGVDNLSLPNEISLIYILGGASGILILTLILYRIFK